MFFASENKKLIEDNEIEVSELNKNLGVSIKFALVYSGSKWSSNDFIFSFLFNNYIL